jgi:hypothetical protein
MRHTPIERGDTAVSAPFKRLLPRAIAIGRRRQTLKDATLKLYVADLDRRLSWNTQRRCYRTDRDASCARPSPPTGRICSSSSPETVQNLGREQSR